MYGVNYIQQGYRQNGFQTTVGILWSDFHIIKQDRIDSDTRDVSQSHRISRTAQLGMAHDVESSESGQGQEFIRLLS